MIALPPCFPYLGEFDRGRALTGERRAIAAKGQTALQKSNDLYGELPPNSRRLDIPKEMLPAENRLLDGRKYLDVARHEFTDMAPVLKLAREIVRAQELK